MGRGAGTGVVECAAIRIVIEIAAPAKINLGLAVESRRSDGYHDIDTIMVKLDLCDTIRLEVLPEPEVRASALAAADEFVAARAPAVNDANLAVRAARLYLEAADWPGGVRMQLGKAIPISAGLGGGSSDAGSVLRGLAQLYPRGLDLGALALRLGSDVPFFVSHATAARARGRGDRLNTLRLPACHALLVNPGVAVAAGEAYAWWTGPHRDIGSEAILAALRSGSPLPLRNDLQPGVSTRIPEVAAVLAALSGLGLDGLMSGSGATCFALTRDPETARAAAARLAAEHPEWWLRAVRFPRDDSPPQRTGS